MNLVQLEYLVAAVEEGSFKRASEKNYVTPQAVSKAINELENELEVKLFVKQGNFSVPTPFGIFFSERAAEILECASDLRSLAKNHCEESCAEGNFRIAILSSPLRGNVVNELEIPLLIEAFPRVNLTVIRSSSNSCLAALEEGVVDAAIILGRTDEKHLECIKLFSLEPEIAFDISHEFAEKEFVRLSDLAHQRIARPDDLRYSFTEIDRHFTQQGIHPQYADLPPFVEEYRDFFFEQKGFAFVSKNPPIKTLFESLTVKPLPPDERISLSVCFVYCKDRMESISRQIGSYLLRRRAALLS